MLYYVTLAFFMAVYITLVIIMKNFKKQNLTNFIFIAVIFISYIFLVVKVYFDVGFNDWNFQNTLPTVNVSPFMFFTVPLLCFT